MIESILGAALAVLLLIWHCWEAREWRKERMQLIDRIQAKDYAEYRQLDPDKPKDKTEKEPQKPVDWV